MIVSEILYGIFFEPVATLRKLSEEKPILPGLMVFVGVSLFNLTIYRGILLLPINSILEHMVEFLWWYAVMGMVFSFFMLFILAGLFSLLSELFFKKSNAIGLLVCFSFVALVGIMGPALHYGALLLDLKWLGILCSLLVALWVLALQVLSLREALQLSTGQSLLLLLLPGILVSIIFVVVFFTLFASSPWTK